MENVLITVSLVLVIGWFIFSLIELVADALRPIFNWFLRKTGLQQKPKITEGINSSSEKIIGQNAVVIRSTENGRFRVKLSNSEWWAKTNSAQSIKEGAVVLVTGVEGNTLLVEGKEHGST